MRTSKDCLFRSVCLTIIALLTAAVYIQFVVRGGITSYRHGPACDEECHRFQQLMDAWPLGKPKAAVVMLLKNSPINTFAQSTRLFSANFNDAYDYPLIVFHEDTLNTESQRNRLRSLTNSRLFLQVRRALYHHINVKNLQFKTQYKGPQQLTA